MHSGASGLACVDASFAVSAPRDHAYRLYSVLSIIAPPVNVLRRTRRKPPTIRGASAEVVIGQSAAVRAGARPGARPYHAEPGLAPGSVSYHSQVSRSVGKSILIW